MKQKVTAVTLDAAPKVAPSRTTTSPAKTPAASGQQFLEFLGKLLPAQAPAATKAGQPYTVQRGDTLGQVCERALNQSTGKAVSSQEVYAAVERVARANGLKNANLIMPGQMLDLSAVAGPSAARPTTLAKSSSLAQGGGAIPASKLVPSLLAAAAVQASQGASWSKPSATMEHVVEGGAQVSSEFGARGNPFTGRREYHSGIDLAAARGSRIYAPIPGVVAFSGWQPGYGQVVIVRHDNDVETMYGHNAKNLVKAGQEITADTPLAQVGSTGDATGPHVHFEVHKSGVPVNPRSLMGAGSLQIAKAL